MANNPHHLRLVFLALEFPVQDHRLTKSGTGHQRTQGCHYPVSLLLQAFHYHAHYNFYMNLTANHQRHSSPKLPVHNPRRWHINHLTAIFSLLHL